MELPWKMALEPEVNYFPSAKEYEDAQRSRGVGAVWVREHYELSEGFLHGSGDIVRSYFPLANQRLVGEFSCLGPGDFAGITRFARRWGKVGYMRLDEIPEFERAPSIDASADPVNWIWAHAIGVRLVIDLVELLNGDNEEALKVRIRDATVSPSGLGGLPSWPITGIDAVSEDLSTVWPRSGESDSYEVEQGIRAHMFIFGARQNVTVMGRPLPGEVGAGGDYRSLAQELIEQILNKNSRGIHQVLRYRSAPTARDFNSPGPYLFNTFDSVLSVIYHHLTRMVLGNRMKLCEECGNPFSQSHGSQRFCPPAEWEKGESRCALRARERRRKRKV